MTSSTDRAAAPGAKLRFADFAKAATAAAAGGAILMQPILAVADPVEVGSGSGVYEVLAGGARWFVNNNVGFATTSSANGLSEASLGLIGTEGTYAQDDAFDGALSWTVNGAQYDSGTGTLDVEEAGGAVTITAPFRALEDLGQFPEQSVSLVTETTPAINVGLQLHFAASRAVVRSILILQNPTAEAVTVSVFNWSNLGSDGNTQIVDTTDGDTVFEPGVDGWVTTWEQTDTPPSGDPTLTTAFGAPEAVVQASFAPPGEAPTDGNGLYGTVYRVTIPAGQTRRVMQLVQLSSSNEAAAADASDFDNAASLEQTDYLAGLSETERDEIVNWDFAAAAPVAQVPTLTEWAMMALLGLLGLAGAATVRRRYRLSDDHVGA